MNNQILRFPCVCISIIIISIAMLFLFLSLSTIRQDFSQNNIFSTRLIKDYLEIEVQEDYESYDENTQSTQSRLDLDPLLDQVDPLHFKNKSDRIDAYAKMHFHCQLKESLLSVPKSCSTDQNKLNPIYPNIYNSSLFPFYSFLGPGPSAQVNGFRHVVLAAILLQRGYLFFALSPH